VVPVRPVESPEYTSLTVSANLAAAAHRLGDEVDHRSYRDEGHGADTDTGGFLARIAKVCGYPERVNRLGAAWARRTHP